ncbi:MAG: SDR family oxidoreductase [Dehalococcoidia bacterium]|nr:SDR family oxidoreductase [Dehalococcoidia bacterium]
MIQRRSGRIITVTGGGADKPLKGALPYATSKAGTEGLTRNLALEVGPLGITCNCLNPGLVDTPGFPLSGYPPERRASMKPVSPGHAARLTVWLASEAAREVNGQSIDAPESMRRSGIRGGKGRPSSAGARHHGAPLPGCHADHRRFNSVKAITLLTSVGAYDYGWLRWPATLDMPLP